MSGNLPFKRAVLAAVSLAFAAVLAAGTPALPPPTGLRCEYVADPLGVDSTAPRLFWKLAGTDSGERQSARRILVASSAAKLDRDEGDLWDSGKVDSDETIQVSYLGEPLHSAERVYWKVRAWDSAGGVSAWSEPGTWTMGLLEESDWKAKWLTAPGSGYETLRLRREFEVRPGLSRALAFICGLGQYELTLNGVKVGSDVLDPGWTKYDRTCLYDTRDITALLHPGRNAAGVLLGAGMYDMHSTTSDRFVPPGYVPYSYGPQKAIAQLLLEYSDGSVDLVGTDGTWRASPGPITFSSIYDGEDFDARRADPGWDHASFDDSAWPCARVVEGPGGRLRGLSCAAPPIATFETLRPVAALQLADGVTDYDLGQNAALMPRIAVKGPAGSAVRIIPTELLKADGSLDDTACGGRTNWTFTLKGGPAETWFPRFFYRGARYLQVHRLPAKPGGELPVLESIEGFVVRSSSRPVGEFQCSSDLFNRIHALVRWAQRNNMMSVMTDCPQREKRGWLEQVHLNGPSLRYEYDLAQLFTKQVNDMADSQLGNGLVPTTAPEYTVFREEGQTSGDRRNMFGDSPEWGSAFILVPWQQYEFDGDLNLFRTHYDAMKRFVDYLGGRADGDIVNYGLGDWYDIGPRDPGVSQLTPIGLTATAFYYRDVVIMARAAALLGKPDDADAFGARAERIRSAFNRRFFDVRRRTYATGSETANAIPLVMGICAAGDRAAVLDAIVRDIRARGNTFTAGDVGYRYLLRALAEGGRSDVIFAMNNQSDRPGYGYQLRMGATSLTEAWDAGRNSSQDHFMLGQINEWFYHDLAGIQCDPGAPGFRRIVIKPAIVGDLTWVKASYESIQGGISSSWLRDGKKLSLEVTLPANTSATVFVPTADAGTITESGVPIASSRTIKLLGFDGSEATLEASSGHYVIACRLP